MAPAHAPAFHLERAARPFLRGHLRALTARRGRSARHPHRKLQNRNAMVGVAAGWHTHLTILEDVLRSRTPGAFWRTFNPLEEEYERRVTPDAEPSR
jgi:hypothetical protein